jgi:hypothetical protein
MSLQNKFGGEYPTNPEQVTEIINIFIKKWRQKEFIQTVADKFITEIIQSYNQNEIACWKYYERLKLILLGEIARIERMKLNATCVDSADIVGMTKIIEEYQCFVNILETV